MVYNTSMLSEDLIKRLRESKDFEFFTDHIIEQVSALDTLRTLGDLDADDVAVEVKARARAVQILENILSPVVSFKEKRELTDEEIEKAEKKYGLK